MEGHVKSVFRLLAWDGVLPLDSDINGVSVHSILLQKHLPVHHHFFPLPLFYPTFIVFDNTSIRKNL